MERIKLRQRVLVDMSKGDLSTIIVGQALAGSSVGQRIQSAARTAKSKAVTKPGTKQAAKGIIIVNSKAPKCGK